MESEKDKDLQISPEINKKINSQKTKKLKIGCIEEREGREDRLYRRERIKGGAIGVRK